MIDPMLNKEKMCCSVKRFLLIEATLRLFVAPCAMCKPRASLLSPQVTLSPCRIVQMCKCVSHAGRLPFREMQNNKQEKEDVATR